MQEEKKGRSRQRVRVVAVLISAFTPSSHQNIPPPLPAPFLPATTASPQVVICSLSLSCSCARGLSGAVPATGARFQLSTDHSRTYKSTDKIPVRTFALRMVMSESSNVTMGHRNLLTVLLHAAIWLLLLINACCGTQSDVQCLKHVQASLSDPNGYLKDSWDFTNITEGSICRFSGVECWHPDENRVINLRLANMSLQGQFPPGLQNCTSLTGLDLSNNNLSGQIPSDISTILTFVTSLDLSYNSFSGKIPADLANCSFLNVLNLQHNRLTGGIPQSLSQLRRLTALNVSDNSLRGPIPRFANPNIPASSFANNAGLCGSPLGPCKSKG